MVDSESHVQNQYYNCMASSWLPSHFHPANGFMSSLISKHPISVIRQMFCKIDQLLMLATVSKIIAYH